MKDSFQLTMAVTPDHRNQYLFSDHYLNHLLYRDPRWDAALPEAETFLAWLQALYADEQDQLSEYNENQLEEHWFKPIFEQLGHVFETQASVPGLDHHAKRPDYVFFSDQAARQEAAGLQNEEAYSDKALTVGEVKRWDTPLGKKRKEGGPSFDDQNPSWQIDYYVRATGLDWGMLTNGRLWRLVHEDSSQRLSIYYEVDLVELLNRSDAEALRYFILFFRQAAFRPNGQGRVFLDDALAASNAYAVALEGDLEENVYRALKCLMQGFLDLPANDLGPDDVREVYDNSLYLLYRLLFILYGESRGLLPMDNDQYREYYSLQSIERRIADDRVPISALTTVLWAELNILFHIINGDNAELNRSLGVPRYNGGLFDPQQHPFLEQKAVGDRALGEAIDLLSRRETREGREFVDYRSLGVRHLGSIYEKLLEYQPRVERPLGSRKTLKVSGQVYLETDRGERKATGSYYTPQYIVAYIVEHTLGPLVEEAKERVKARVTEAKSEAARVEAEQSLIENLLNLKVLDPAMGSGHFLVEATEFLALELATDPYAKTEAPVMEEDLTHWKRRVVERCIYGVDKNPLAVELAKLSLWLATVAAGRPLSFLNHHLKCGDSLVGARVDGLGEAPPVMSSKKVLRERKARYEAGARQANLFETRLTEKLPVVMGRILEITKVESVDYDTVRAKEAADRAVRELKAPFEAVANLWISAYFGNEFINGEYDEALMRIGQPDVLLALDAVQRAQAMADERHFFHWELAFPEVFYDERGQRLGERAGFDAVVGNPPYGMLQPYNTPQPVLNYLKGQFETCAFKVDTFVLFIETGVKLAKQFGGIGMIVPNTFVLNVFAQRVRQFLLEKSEIRHLLLSQEHLFPEADIHNAIFIARRVDHSAKRPASRVKVVRNVDVAFLQGRIASTNAVIDELGQDRLDFTGDGAWNIRLSEQVVSVLSKIENQSQSLDKLAYVNRGLITGDRDKYFSDQKVNDRWRPILSGGDIYRYFITRPQEYVLFERPETAGGCWDEKVHFHPKKLVMRQIGSYPRAAIDYNQYCVTGNIFTVRVHTDLAPLYVLTILNSALTRSIWALLFQDFKVSFTELKAEHINQLPIRRIEFTTPAGERERLAAEAKERAEQSIKALAASGAIGADTPMDRVMLSQAASPALDFVEERLEQKPEQADVIHDLLAHLAERMIEMNEQKQAYTETFWLDLEGVTGAEVFETLRHKGKWERTLWRKSKACRPFVDEESRSTRHLDESLAWNEAAFKSFVKALAGRVANLSDVIGVYHKHHDDFLALVARTAAADWLIDQIVYKLYGLTKEEIAIVERGD